MRMISFIVLFQLVLPFGNFDFIFQTSKTLSFFDFGANNIDNFIYLNRYLKNWQYIYHDLPHYNDT